MDRNYVNYCAKNLLDGLSYGNSDMNAYMDQLAGALTQGIPPYNLRPEHKTLWLLAATIAALTEPRDGP
jgi:hypothetical protein